MISAVAYGADGVTEYDDIAAARDAAGTTWVRASDVSTADLRTVADAFDIHPLVVENVRDGVRPKTEEYAEHTFTLIKTDELVSGDRIFAEEVTDETVGICFGGDWVLTMTMVPGTPIERVWQAVLDGDERVLQRGPDFTAYRVMDVVVDGYFNLLDRLEDQIERIEEEVTVSTDIETLDAINALRRDLLAFRKLVWPCRGAVDISPAAIRNTSSQPARSTSGTCTTISYKSWTSSRRTATSPLGRETFTSTLSHSPRTK